MARASVVETEKERQRANAAQQRRVSMAALKQSQQQQHHQQLQQPSVLASPTTSTRQASTPLPPSRRRPVNPLPPSRRRPVNPQVDDANVDASPLSAVQTSPLRARARAISRRSAAPMPTPITADFVAELAASQEALPSNLLSLVTVSEFISFSRMT